MKPSQQTEHRPSQLTSETTSLELRVQPILLPKFFRILQQGFMLRTRLGRSVGAILFQELGLSGEFLDAKVQTLFLNGKTIDDPHSALVPDEAVIALSSAMPGLVGATLRRGSTYAAMRSQITYSESEAPMAEKDGTITLKIYNLLLDELGETVLKRGILVGRDMLAEFFEEQKEPLRNGCTSAVLNGVEVEPNDPAGMVRRIEAAAGHLVRLTVVPAT